MKIRVLPFLFVTLILFMRPAVAVKIVRMELEYGSDIVATGRFDIPYTKTFLDLELFDDVTGLNLKLFDGVSSAPAPVATVANFLNYVSNGRYDQTFFNRSIPNFVVQTGGVTNMPTDPDNESLGGAFGVVEEFPPVVNEPGLSNVRGTIAMAKVPAAFVEPGCAIVEPGCTLRPGTGPDSANSEWFINLSDNSPLNTIEGGFTVFGNVIDDGLVIADQIASFPVTDISFFFGGSYTDLPIADRNPNGGGTIFSRNIVTVLSVTEINRPILRLTPTASNFGFESTGNSAAGKMIDVVLKNTGNEVLDISSIGIGSSGSPFSILTDNCDSPLTPISAISSSCIVSLKFLPISTGVFNEDLIIEYTNGQVSSESFSVKHSLIGEGALGPPSIVVTDSFDVGVSQVDGFSTSKDIIVSNSGQASLQISAISILNSTNFSQTNDCIGNSILIAPGETCAITVNFTTNDFDVKTATLSIDSNDPANDSVDIVLSGYGDNDADGILSAIEDAAPNAGDNNFDGLSDSGQNDVSSFVSNAGAYITLQIDENNVISNVQATSTNQLIDLPADAEFKYGAFEFQIDVAQAGAITEVGLILPVATSELEAYYFFGETADNTEHWYVYEATQLITKATINAPNGSQGVYDFIRLVVQDGGTGDADKVANGRILLALGAPAYSTNTSGGNGGSAVNILFLIFFVVILLANKRRS